MAETLDRRMSNEKTDGIDPSETLEEIRTILGIIATNVVRAARRTNPYFHIDNDDGYIQDSTRIMNLIFRLDRHITNGGTLPEQWKRT